MMSAMNGANVKRYKIERNWGEGEVTLDVDHDKLTPELATTINAFWTGSQDRIDEADGDVVLAVIKLAGAEFMGWVLDVNSSYSVAGMQREFDSLEGWPAGGHGIRILDFDDRPEIDSGSMQVTEVTRD